MFVRLPLSLSCCACAATGDRETRQLQPNRQIHRRAGQEEKAKSRTACVGRGDLNNDGATCAVLYTIEGQNGSETITFNLAVFLGLKVWCLQHVLRRAEREVSPG
jgi:hypothetical protein